MGGTCRTRTAAMNCRCRRPRLHTTWTRHHLRLHPTSTRRRLVSILHGPAIIFASTHIDPSPPSLLHTTWTRHHLLRLRRRRPRYSPPSSPMMRRALPSILHGAPAQPRWWRRRRRWRARARVPRAVLELPRQRAELPIQAHDGRLLAGARRCALLGLLLRAAGEILGDRRHDRGWRLAAFNGVRVQPTRRLLLDDGLPRGHERAGLRVDGRGGPGSARRLTIGVHQREEWQPAHVRVRAGAAVAAAACHLQSAAAEAAVGAPASADPAADPAADRRRRRPRRRRSRRRRCRTAFPRSRRRRRRRRRRRWRRRRRRRRR